MLRSVKPAGALNATSSGRYAASTMRTTPELQAKLRQRLQEAVDRAGSADALGRLLGWTNGGPVRQCLATSSPRNVTPGFILRANESSATWLHGWFDGLMPLASQVDVLRVAHARRALAPWPFMRITSEEWAALDSDERAIVEDIARSKLRDLLAERAILRKRRRAGTP